MYTIIPFQNVRSDSRKERKVSMVVCEYGNYNVL